MPESPEMTEALGRAVTVIGPRRGLAGVGLSELWEYRELIYFFVWRDLKVRYRQTFFGAAWAVIQPLLLMAVFTAFLGRVSGIAPDGIPYPLFTFAALVPWTLFAQSIAGAGNSLVESATLLSKVYFPRLVLPISSICSYIIDFLIALAVLFIMVLAYGLGPSIDWFWLLPLTLFAVAAAMAVGIWLAALNVRYRDVRHAIPFLVQLWLLASPVAYSSAALPEAVRGVYAFNPMAGVVEGFRWAITGAGPRPDLTLLTSGVATLVLLLTGLTYFRRVERTLVDVI